MTDNAAAQQLAERLFRQAAQSYATGHALEAVALAKRALTHQSDHPGALYLIGGATLDDQRAAEALPYLEAAARADNNHPDIQRALGLAHLSLGHWESAAASLQHALSRYPQDAGLLNNLGIAFKELGNPAAAIECYRKALAVKRDDANVYNNLAIALDKQRDYPAAIDAYQQSVRLDSNNAAVWFNLSVLLEQGNRVDEAETAVERGLALAPRHPGLTVVAAKCRRRRHDAEGAIRLLQPLLQKLGADKETRRAAEFELGRDFDSLGDTDSAFQHFSLANRLATEVWPELAEAARAYDHELDALIESFTADWVKTWSARSRPRHPATTPSLIFLVGFLRSGTTLMDTLLGEHPELTVLEEEPCLENTLNRLRTRQPGPAYPLAMADLTANDWDALRSDYWHAVASRVPAAAPLQIVLDKHPLMSAQAGYIHALLPQARFLFALRHPCDVILSCFMQSFGGSSVLGNFLDLESSAKTYQRVMSLWLRYQQILELNVQELRYEALVSDPAAALRSAFAFLGLNALPEAVDHVAHARTRGRIYTPSYSQVVEPINQRAVGRWRRYAKHFGRAAEILQPYVEQFGYTL